MRSERERHRNKLVSAANQFPEGKSGEKPWGEDKW